jgi:hypothetical protein
MANTLNGMIADNIAIEGISTLEKSLIPMTAFSMDLSKDVAEQGTTVSTRIVPAAAASTDIEDDESGDYSGVVDNQTTTARQITLDPHPANGFAFSDLEMQRIAAGVMNDTLQRMIRTHVRGIAEDVLDTLFALVTNANYGAAGLISTAANFDEEDVADLRTVADNAGWPQGEGTMVLNATFYNALVKSGAIADYSASQSDALRTGVLPTLSGFTIIKAPTLPTNSENLAGFIALPDAALIAMRGVDSQSRGAFEEYRIMQSPVVGATITYSAVYMSQSTRKTDHIFEALYGVQLGQAASLKRITTA